jgi:hypothetical protein
MLGSGSKVSVRNGKPADAKALSRIFKEAWQLAYRGIIPHLHLESMIRQRTPEWWRDALKSGDGTLVLEMAGTRSGLCNDGQRAPALPLSGRDLRALSRSDLPGAGARRAPVRRLPPRARHEEAQTA